MVKQDPVNVKWQVVLTLLPLTSFNIGGFYAAFRIKKLRKFVLLLIVTSIAFVIFDEVSGLSLDEADYFWPSDSIFYWLITYDYIFGPADMSIKLIWLVEDVVFISIIAFFINRWSTEWNEKIFENKSECCMT